MYTIKLNKQSRNITLKKVSRSINLVQTGRRGLDGPAGPDGPAGESAYQIWLDEGNTGTEQDFLDSLKGATGDPGPAGNDGLMQSVQAGTNIDVDATDPANPIVSVENLTAADISDFDTEVANNTTVAANTSARHTHANKALLDTYNQTNANISSAVTDRHTHSNKTTLDATTASFLSAEKTKLSGIESGAEVNNISDANATDLTDGGASTLHYHASDRDRANHTGSQAVSTVTGLQTELDDKLENITGLIEEGTNVTITGAGTVASPYEISASGGGGGGAVDSVNSQTGVVVLDADDIDDTSTTHKYVTSSDLTKLGNLSGTNTGDQTLSGLGGVPTTRTINGQDLSTNRTFTQDNIGDGTTYKQYSQTEKTKLAGIETAADVTDTANVTAAGALMDSEVTNLSQVKAFDSTDYATAAQGTTADSAVQPGDLATVATTGDYDDLLNTPAPPASFVWRGDWVTATAYAVNDCVNYDGSGYICMIAHTSGTFATDLAANRWALLVEKGTDGTNGTNGTTPAKASGAEVVTGTDDTKYTTAKSLRDAKILDHNFAIPTVIVNGVGENTTSTSYNDMAYWKAAFDKSKYTNFVSIQFQVLLQQNNSGGPYQVWCQLVKTDGTPITGSEVTATLGQYGTSVQTSGDIAANLTTGADGYRVQAKTASGGLVDIQGAAIIVNMKA